MKNVPKLRFKEFTDEWEERKLGEVSSISSGLTPLRSEGKYYIDATIPWVKTTDLNNSYIIKTEEKINKIALMETSIKLLPKNTLLIAMYGGFNQIGRTGILTTEATTNQALSAISFIDKNMNSLFFLNFFNYKVNYWKKVSASSRKDPNITKKDIEDFKICFPDTKEQKKIANFLSSVDKKISITEEKLNLFNEYKKGIMQKIFNQELRFKDENGNDYPEWEEKKLGEISNIYQPKTISQNEMTDIGFLVYGANGIIGKYSEYNHETSQIAVTCRGNTCGTVNFTKEKSWITGNAMVINTDEYNNICKKFLFFNLKNDNLKYLITGSGQPQITGEIKNHKINIPCFEEQQKIADFLSAIDTKIEKISDELENLKEFKKGLLQQMFV